MEQRTLGWGGLPVSILGLGTVELGTRYGITAEAPPPRKEAIALLHYAVDKGITYIDTARSYGGAEELIGESGVGKKPGVLIGTKCGAFYERGEDPRGDELRLRVTEEVEASLHALQRETIDLLQLHGPSAAVIQRGEVTGVLEDLKRQGKVRYFGVSVRGEEAAIAVIYSNKFQAVQVAVSILDQRMRRRVLREAFAEGLGIIARSVLLKGVLTPHRVGLPARLETLQERADAVERFVVRSHLTLVEAAFRFVLSLPEISTILIGTTNKQQIDEAVAFVERGMLPVPIKAELDAFRIDDEQLVDPSHWGI